MIMRSDLSLSATIAKYYGRLVRGSWFVACHKHRSTLSTAFDLEALKDARLLLQQGFEQNQSGGPALGRVRPAGAALPVGHDPMYQNQGNIVQDDIQPSTQQSRTPRPSSSVTVSPCTHIGSMATPCGMRARARLRDLH
jgi:hypothetical protein